MPPPLLLDVHVHYGACRRLQAEGIHVQHTADAGLGEAEDLELLLAAAEAGRVVVTRNYKHFAPLVETLAERGKSFPGVLFLSPSIPHSDLSGHLRALRRWCERAGDGNPVEDTYGWISLPR